MGSVDEKSPVIGQFMHPLITANTANTDAWQRNYFAPPPLKPLVPKNYPLIDLRPLLLHPDYSPTDLLQTYGIGIVRHHSTFLDRLDEDLSEHAVAEEYHPEVQELVAKVTGAKQVFVTASVFRQGKRVPAEFKFPTFMRSASQAVAADQGTQSGVKDARPAEAVQPHRLAGQSKLALSEPVRVPHMDFTPLGARQTIRSHDQDIHDAAVQSGVIAAEDQICENQPFTAPTKAADSAIAEHYNRLGKLGPRYAAYSIWRPLKKVGRDPISFASRKELPTVGGDLVHWPYENKIPGSAELNGDYLREYAMLGAREAETPAVNDGADALKWYYVSEQLPDEVLFIKLFDSASLGADSQHAGAPWHASPEIGDAAKSDDPRESIDIRVLAFW